MRCTYSATLQDKLRPQGFLALTGRDGEPDGEKPDGEQDKDDATSGKSGDVDGEDGNKPDPNKLADGETVAELRRQLANYEEERERNARKRLEAQNEVKDLKVQIDKLRKDGTPDDAVKQENEQLKSANAKFAETNQRLMLQIAMRDDTAHSWVDPDAALALADLSEVEFDEKTLKPVGLKAALDKLAKAKPFLLKPKDDGEGSGDGRGTGKPPAGGRQKTTAEQQARSATLAAKYPALRR